MASLLVFLLALVIVLQGVYFCL